MQAEFSLDTQKTLAALARLGDLSDWETVVLAGGETLVDEVVAGGKPWLTGNLLGSYHVEGTGRDGNGVYADVGTNVEYAPPQEFIYTPHFRPAMERGADRITADMAAAATQLLNRKA